jgi:hypothetical protein
VHADEHLLGGLGDVTGVAQVTGELQMQVRLVQLPEALDRLLVAGLRSRGEPRAALIARLGGAFQRRLGGPLLRAGIFDLWVPMRIGICADSPTWGALSQKWVARPFY